MTLSPVLLRRIVGSARYALFPFCMISNDAGIAPSFQQSAALSRNMEFYLTMAAVYGHLRGC
jgi:hypothetical protein